MIKTRWYKDAVVYQIYPRSFCDSNGDGIGDLRGIISKLDYIKDLGVDAVWLSPIYKSPNDDNGYDISDYTDIMDEFGTLDDFKELLEGLHSRGIKLIMDLVANHTSDEHYWFRESKKSVDNPYRDYYIWRKGRGKDGKKPPNNWTSSFGGKAWEYDETTGEWYLHLFSRKQPDLNWENPKVRQEIADICNYWMDMGVDGFRCDVITYISKKSGLPDGKFNPIFCGSEQYVVGPRYHEFIKELNAASWSRYDSFTVGEAAGITISNAYECIDESVCELDTVFSFEHLCYADMYFLVIPHRLSLKKFKKILGSWQALPKTCQNTLFLENHDQPRSVSRFGDDGEYRELSAKMLATCLHMMQGTPYIYQGEELGMTNVPFKDISDFRDLDSINAFHELVGQGVFTEDEMMKYLRYKSRDNARTPFQWDDTEHAGFTAGTPWIMVNPNYREINAREQLEREGSVFRYYQQLIRLRKEHEVIVYGSYDLLLPDDMELYVYTRTLETEKLLVICNFYGNTRTFALPDGWTKENFELLIGNYGDISCAEGMVTVRSYEALVLKMK